jgi:decaprenyl-phosphate phosphoribosyltransferase
MRVDHWFKNVFIVPGILVALSIADDGFNRGMAARIALGFFAMCLIASSNYVLNEVLDAPFDRHHPTKRSRPVPGGRVSIPYAYLQWIVIMLVAVALAWLASPAMAATVFSLWLAGCVYNIPPLRSKDRAYIDVLTESLNNPIRMLAGWFMVGPDAVAPGSLLLSYWMIGCYFMAIKRFAEYRFISDRHVASAYRKSFARNNEDRLLTSIMFYASAAMLFLGVFVIRYRLELVLSFP